MNERMRRALAAAAAGDAALRTGLGIERHSVRGKGFPGGGREWEERLSVRGDGGFHLLQRRSFADQAGGAIGTFAGTLEEADLVALIDAAAGAQWEALGSFRIEPADLAVALGVAVDGESTLVRVGGGDPAALAPVKALLDTLDRTAALARSAPEATLELELGVAAGSRAGSDLEVELVLRNRGVAGAWLTHPCGDGLDARDLVATERREPTPGVTPLPPTPVRAALEPLAPADRALLWLGSGAEETLPFRARAPLAPGTWRARAILATYAGSDALHGQPRLRGWVSSKKVSFDVG